MTGGGRGPHVIGLTGGIGVGKSTVAAMLHDAGATIIDCDELGRLVVEPDGSAFDGVVARFDPETGGRGIVGGDGRLDRPALASIVFADPQALADLNAITHPAIDREIERLVAAADTPIVVLDMAVLVESDLGRGQYREVLVVEAPLPARIRRLTGSRGMDEAAVRSRIESQVDDGARRAVADHVIVNDGTVTDLRAAVDRYWRQLTARAG